jgi:Ras-related protein Rab-1A
MQTVMFMVTISKSNVRKMRTPLRVFKVVIIGDTAVGKSSLLLRFADDAFTESYISTIGVDFRFKQLNLSGHIVKMQMWDTAGQERFRTITSAYYRAADGIVIVYDVCNRASFDDIAVWVAELAKHDAQKLPILLIANKSDRPDRSVTTQEGVALAESLNISMFTEASAKSGSHVNDAFRELAVAMLKGSSSNGIADTETSQTNMLSMRIKRSATGETSQSNSCC